MKYATSRPYADPEKAAQRLMEHAQAFEPIQDGRIYIEKINGRSCLATGPRLRSTAPAWSWRSSAGGWSCMRGGTFVKLTQNGADLFA
jgi:hypothetical protein